MSTDLIPQRLRDRARPARTPSEDRRPLEVAYDIDEDTNAGRRGRRRTQLRTWAQDAGIDADDLLAVELGQGVRSAVYVWDRDDQTGELLTEDGGTPVMRRIALTDVDEDDAPNWLFGGRNRRRPRRRRSLGPRARGQ